MTGTLTRDSVTVGCASGRCPACGRITANYYRRRRCRGARKLPAVIAICGHGNVVENGVSCGSKVKYQRRPAWFARHGVRLSDPRHAGTRREQRRPPRHLLRGRWDWHTLGYTPAGVECWNAMRAADPAGNPPGGRKARMSESPAVGEQRDQLVGDDRRRPLRLCSPGRRRGGRVRPRRRGPAAVQGRAGTPGHCDCMYLTNTYRWDFATVSGDVRFRGRCCWATATPTRSSVPAYRRVMARMKVYDLYGVEAVADARNGRPAPRHAGVAARGIPVALPVAAARPGRRIEGRPHRRRGLKCSPLPDDSRNPTADEVFARPAKSDLPASPRRRRHVVGRGVEAVAGRLWRRGCSLAGQSPPPLDVKPAADITVSLRLRGVGLRQRGGSAAAGVYCSPPRRRRSRRSPSS